MNVLDATRAWMRAQCPLINRQNLFNANYLGAEPTEYTLRTASESHRTDVLGYDLAEYNLTFVAQLPFGRVPTRPAINYKSNSILRRNNHGRSCYQPDRRPKS